MSIQLAKTQRNNLCFLIVEVGTQISNLQNYIANAGTGSIGGSFDRAGYIHNLKIRLHNDSYQQRLKAGDDENAAVGFRAINNIANNLERIAELCLDCSYHVNDLLSNDYEFGNEYEKLLDRVALGISLIERANQDNNTQQALKIADIQQKLSTLYSFTTLYQFFKNKKDSPDNILKLSPQRN